jgi:predicted small secreted protein
MAVTGRPSMARLVTALVIPASLALAACGSSEPSDQDIDQAYENAQDQLGGTTFEGTGDTGDCTEDCGGHDAGYNWAQEQGITDPGECSGDSQSFVEGCQAYAGAVEEAAEDELNSDDD